MSDRPITLITATPGGGKTALAVQIMKKAVEAGRPLFVMGIPDLKLPYIPTPPISEWTELREDPENPGLMMPYFTFPENSFVVLDEAQRVFRLRSAASKVPDHVAAFETVRHTGVTFLLITQSPAFIDSHIRQLVGKHIHLRDVGLLGRWYYEWPETANPSTYSTAPIKSKWKLPKESFPLYKSASMHIKRRYTIPPVIMIMIICLVVSAGLGIYVYRSMSAKIAPSKPQEQQAQKKEGGGQAAPQQIAKVSAPKDAAAMLMEFSPVIPGRPETAPAYDQLRQVKNMPRVAGCIQTKKSCTCQNQQGTDAGLDEMQCRAWLRNPPFDAYFDVALIDTSKRPAAAPVHAEQPVAPSPVATAPVVDPKPLNRPPV